MANNSKKDEFRERKERVLHTRVPEILEKELKRLSESLRLPVSNIVRAVLEDALEAAEYAGRTVQEEAWNVAERISWLNRYSGRVVDHDKTSSEEEGVDQSDSNASWYFAALLVFNLWSWRARPDVAYAAGQSRWVSRRTSACAIGGVRR
jgi:hypothetical protein